MSSKITVGKVVPTANDTGWSQAYHAGGFTAVISVTKQEEKKTEKTLAATGKELLDTLVSEYFTLTTKDLQTVKEAVTTTIAKTPKDVEVGLVVAAVIKNVLYAVIAHEGRVLLKRGEKLGLLLGLGKEETEEIATVSGFLETGDAVLLHTSAFGKIFPHDELVTAFDHKSAEELAETFAPKIHEAQEPTAAALIFSFSEDESSFTEPTKSVSPMFVQQEEEKHEETQKPQKGVTEHEREETNTALPGFETPLPVLKKSQFSFSHRQRLFLTIAIILGIVLIASIVVFQYRGQQQKLQAAFTEVYNPANTKFSEAKGLLDLNKALAIEDLQSAQSQLQHAKSQFPANSSQGKQLATLLSQVTQTLNDAQKIPLVPAQKAPDGASPLLSFAATHSGVYITEDSTNFYTADNNGVTSYDQKTNSSQKIITNKGDWKTIGGFDTYYGNFYVLDQSAGILKYVPAGSGYTSSSYFASGVTPDLSKAVSMSIDSSVWILTSDGTITRYTRGTQDSLSITGLDTPLKDPTQILTSANLSNVYILDKGNGRIVVLNKSGNFIAQYASDTVRTTSMIDVTEKNKEIYLLSNGTVYQIDLK